jgi:hypothetical protein
MKHGPLSISQESRMTEPSTDPHKQLSVRGDVRFYAAMVMLGWSAVLVGLLLWNINSNNRQVAETIRYQARAFFEQILTTRFWNASHGGVYVPVTETTRPNPFLEDPDRDLTTTSGMELTKINPAFMTRQIAEIAMARNKVHFHITSRRPIRPANAADPWETAALESFEQGVPEVFAKVAATGSEGDLFRFMAPLWVDEPCLQCHATQGYKLHDLRGGISVTIPAVSVEAAQKRHTSLVVGIYGLIWAIGLVGIWLGAARLRAKERQQTELIDQLQEALAEVKQLSGFLPICASCKKIRDDKGYWQQIEAYISSHSEAVFSHGICAECARKLYPEIFTDEVLSGIKERTGKG